MSSPLVTCGFRRTQDGTEAADEDGGKIEEREPLLDFMTLVPGGNDEDKSREESSLEDTKENTANAKETPVGNKAHSNLRSAPSDNTGSEERAGAKESEQDIGRDLPLHVFSTLSSTSQRTLTR